MAGAQQFSSAISPPTPSTPSTISIQLPPFYAAQNYLLAILPLLSLLVYLIYQDYLAFLALGPGGTPYNFYGYSKITVLRLFALRDPYVPHAVPEGLQHNGFLPKGGIPKRDSLRPTVIGIAPHRQLDQRPSSDVFLCLSRAIAALAERYPRRLAMGTSSFEKHCAGLFSKTQVNRTSNGEVVHAHPSDCSMHITLHPADAKVVIEAGWGGTWIQILT